MNNKKIMGVILAAGESSRMGFPKPLLKIRGINFTDIIRKKLLKAGINDICLILGADADYIKKNLNTQNLNIIINKSWRKGQLSSLKTALGNIPTEAEAIMMCLIDHPQVKIATIRKLVKTYEKNEADIVIPVYKGRGGHPVIFSRSVFGALAEAPLDKGAKAVTGNPGYKILRINVEDPYIRQDIDSSEEYKKIGIK